jgi:hypothetical protein
VYQDYLKETQNLKLANKRPKRKQIVMYGIPVWADSYFPNDWGLYNIAGNVAEMANPTIELSDSLYYCGGSYKLDARFMNLNWMMAYPGKISAQPDVGFRPIMTYIYPLMHK